MKSDNPGGRYWRTQLPVDFLDNALVIDVWETVSLDLSEGAPAALLFVIVEQTNNGAAVEDLEFEMAINGTAYTWAMAGLASGARAFARFQDILTAGDFTPISGVAVRTFGQFEDANNVTKTFNAQSVELIRVRQTTAVDVVSAQIEVNISWDKLVSP